MPHWGAGQVLLLNLLEPLYDVLRQYVLMPGKVHADDIPVPVREPGSGKTGQPGCGSTSVMTVTPVHRCPGGLVRVQSGPEGIHPQNHLPVTACASGRCLRWLPGVIRIRQNNGSRVYGSCPEKIHDIACKSAHLHHHGSPAAYR